jgi:large subunit ribosomal protein L29
MASIVELREISDERLLEMLENAREELFNLRFQHASARLDDISRIRKVRRELAQFETVLRQRELAVKRALQDPEVVAAVEGKEWLAEAHFDYEISAWMVEFVDEEEDELVTAEVDLNRKKPKGRRARQATRK